MLGGYSIYTHLIRPEALHASFHTGDMALLDEYLLDGKLTKSFPFSLSFPLDLRCPEANLKPISTNVIWAITPWIWGTTSAWLVYPILVVVPKAAWNPSESEKVYHGWREHWSNLRCSRGCSGSRMFSICSDPQDALCQVSEMLCQRPPGLNSYSM